MNRSPQAGARRRWPSGKPARPGSDDRQAAPERGSRGGGSGRKAPRPPPPVPYCDRRVPVSEPRASPRFPAPAPRQKNDARRSRLLSGHGRPRGLAAAIPSPEGAFVRKQAAEIASAEAAATWARGGCPIHPRELLGTRRLSLAALLSDKARIVVAPAPCR